ncbi:DUF5719 family protein [Nostocoides sp. HKS02]|uniref:DUF5719 family protein n=1 Tax=Nostocoides sp. HKS02 TaxID=1813880 RepID=UPI0012B49407|nr:DUF5719 family protein [Tetrasphaera sp. HKS02]QGN56681.1 hypothetical protein GKE56_00830 [Tetrasphaera sp. HKS02]
MSVSVFGVVRAVVVAAAGAGLVYGATHVPGAVAVVPSSSASAATQAASSAPVQGSSLVCPGPELVGVQGLHDLPVGVHVAAAAAPLQALPGTQPPATPGALALTGMPGAALGAPATDRGKVVATGLTSATGVLVAGTQSLAPGLAATQSSLVTSGDQRALTSTPCTRPGADLWLLAGGSAPGRQERLVLTNPGGNPVTVDVTLHGADGPVQSAIGKGLVVPAHGRTAFLLDSISATLSSPAVHVVTQGGVVGAAVNDSWLNGTLAAGADDASPAAAPSRDQVIPNVEVNGPAVLRVVVPGDGEAVVQARVLTAQGPRALPSGGVTRVAGGTVHDIDISALPAGASALQVRADVPVVACAVVARYAKGTAVSDYAWSVSTAPITGAAGMPFADTAKTAHSLDLTATGDSLVAQVDTVSPAGDVQSQRVSIQADSTAQVKLPASSSVWVHRVSGQGELHAGVTTSLADALGPLLTSTPLVDTLLRTTTVALSEVQP